MEGVISKLVKLSETERTLKIDASSSSLIKKEEDILKRYSKKASIDGFRKGKVPLAVLKKMLGDSLRQEAIEDVCKDAYLEVIKKREIVPLTKATLNDIKEKDTKISFTASFEVMPDIEIDDKDITIEVPGVTEEDIDKSLEEMRFSHATYIPVVRLSVPGDYLVIDYDYLKKERGILRPERVTNFGFIIGKDTVPEEFNRKLINKRIGERVEMKINYSPDYQYSSVAGRSVTYRITINEIKEIRVPPFDDQFAKRLGFETLAELREDVKKTLFDRREKSMEKILPSLVLSKLVDRHSFSPPKVFVEIAYQNWKEDVEKGKVEDVDEEEIKKRAVFDARARTILHTIAEREQIAITDEEIRETLLKSLSQGEISSIFKDDNRLEYVRELMRREKALDLVVGRASLEVSSAGSELRWK